MTVPAWHPMSAQLAGIGGGVSTPWLASPTQEETQPFGVCWLQGDCPHQGIDVAAPAGTPIVSQVYGTLEELRDPTGFGNYQLIHVAGQDETITLGHEASWLVPPGPVVPGEQIALEGSSGYSTGPHLHLGVQQGGKWIDPSGVLFGTGTAAATAAPASFGSKFLSALHLPDLTDLFWRVGLVVFGLLLVLVGLGVTFQAQRAIKLVPAVRGAAAVSQVAA